MEQAVLAVLLCAGLAATARADTFNVSTPQELQNAITTAADTVGDDTINLAAGTYAIGSKIGTVDLRAFDADDGSSNGITDIGASLHLRWSATRPTHMWSETLYPEGRVTSVKGCVISQYD